MNLQNKKVLLVGLGLQGGGVSTVKWLVKQKAKVTVSDLKNKQQLVKSLRALSGLSAIYHFGRHPLTILKHQDLVVQNPAVPNNSKIIQTAEAKGIPIENEASLFFKFCPAPIVAITGSKGKSTTTSILGNIFKKYNFQAVVAGNIRDQIMLDVLPKIKTNTPVILELSSWQLEGLGRWRLSPQVSVVTNILPDHLNRYVGLKDYAQAKANIFLWQKKSDKVILNYDNPWTKKMASQAKSQIYWFSSKQPVTRGAYIFKGNIYYREENKKLDVLPISQIKLLGKHNLDNILAATATALACGVPLVKVRQGLKTFKGLHSRLELIAIKHKVAYYNDTTATNPDATIAGIKTFSRQRLVLIAGGMDKNVVYTKLANLIKKKVKQLILLPGSATDKLVAQLGRNYFYQRASSMREAVDLAKNYAKSSQVVLLSPAAASFGLFVNEWDRGEQFIKAVKSLK